MPLGTFNLKDFFIFVLTVESLLMLNEIKITLKLY